jgi:hypothetical protein
MATYPTINDLIFDKAITYNLSSIDDNSILSAQFSDTIRDVQSDDPYYVRIPASTNNALNKYN